MCSCCRPGRNPICKNHRQLLQVISLRIILCRKMSGIVKCSNDNRESSVYTTREKHEIFKWAHTETRFEDESDFSFRDGIRLRWKRTRKWKCYEEKSHTHSGFIANYRKFRKLFKSRIIRVRRCWKPYIMYKGSVIFLKKICDYTNWSRTSITISCILRFYIQISMQSCSFSFYLRKILR